MGRKKKSPNEDNRKIILIEGKESLNNFFAIVAEHILDYAEREKIISKLSTSVS